MVTRCLRAPDWIAFLNEPPGLSASRMQKAQKKTGEAKPPPLV